MKFKVTTIWESILFLIIVFIVGGWIRKINVFDAFIEGAKGGFDIILKIIPYLVAMLVAIRVFRDSGALDYVIQWLSYAISAMGFNTEFVPALPVAIMRPFSGAGSRGLMLDIFKNPLYGPDSFVGKMASTLMGSADTTFYILALYFGSVGIKKVRYAVWAGLLADLLGVIAAILIGYLFISNLFKNKSYTESQRRRFKENFIHQVQFRLPVNERLMGTLLNL